VRYEYKTCLIPKERADATLTEYGQQGWRVAHFIDSDPKFLSGFVVVLLEKKT